MPLGVDLGFLDKVLVTAAVLAVTVLGLWFRREWRRHFSRQSEVERRLAFASEEILRAEIEARLYGYGGYDDGYSYGSGVREVGPAPTGGGFAAEVEVEEKHAEAPQGTVRQCEVCSVPTTSRCKQCKAVWYCSGKCQIDHWRQSHKDECRPFTVRDQSRETGASTLLKPSTGEKIHNNVIHMAGGHLSEQVETDAKQSAYLNSDLPKSLNRVHEAVGKPFTEGKGSLSNSSFTAPTVINEHPKVSSNGSSLDESRDAHRYDSSRQSSVPSHSKTVNGYHNIDKEKPPAMANINSGANLASSARASIIYTGSVHVDGHCQSTSTSSSSCFDGSNESSSEPSSPSSGGFWDGTINSTRCRIDGLDDSNDIGSYHPIDIDDLSSQLTSSSTRELARTFLHQSNISGKSNKAVSTEGANSTKSEIKKPSNGSSSLLKDDKVLDTQKLSSMGQRIPQVDPSNRVESAACLKSTASSLSTSTLELNTESAKHRSIPKETKASEDTLSSNHERHSVQNVKLAKDHKPKELPSCSDSHVLTHDSLNNSKKSVWKAVDQLKASKFALLSTLGVVTENTAKYNSKGLFPYDLFVKLYHWNKDEMLPCGLVNCGNSCYANAVLQCLSLTPPLTAYFLQGLHSKTCNKTDWCFTCEFENLVRKAKDGNGKSPISPSRMLSKIQTIGCRLGNGREEDAHEFLRYVIETMQAVCLKAVGVSASSFSEETTLPGLTFGGYLRSKIVCMRCGNISERHERMMDLTVEIEGDIATLEEALRRFTHTETLDGENKYHCSRCKSYEKAKKKLRVLEAPNILTIALKRFQSGKFGKLNKVIKFPEILDLAPYMSGTSDKSPIYRLYGVIVHEDIMNASFSGHYVCYVKNAQNKWFKCDDSTVRAVDLDRVLTKGAYMLLYARCSPRAPRLIRKSSHESIRKSNHPDPKPSHLSRGSWDASVNGPPSDQMSNESIYPHHSSYKPFLPIWEDSSSDKSSSLFSEVTSCSTESSNRDSVSADDCFDQFLGDMGMHSGSPWRNFSDSETSSSSSSPSPLYSRHVPIDLETYTARYPEYMDPAASNLNDSSGIPYQCRVEAGYSRLPYQCSVEAEAEAEVGKGSSSFSSSNLTRQGRKVGGSSSSSKLVGWGNPFENLKSSATFRRSSTKR